MQKPVLTDKEIHIDTGRFIISKRDTLGKIISGNDYFYETTGYAKHELEGQAETLLRHPDMPEVIFKLVHDRILYDDTVTVLMKNLTKSGSHYWAVTEFEVKKDKLTEEIKYITEIGRAAPKSAVKVIEPIYAKLSDIEKRKSIKASEAFLIEILEEEGKSYDDFIDDLAGTSGSYKNLFVR